MKYLKLINASSGIAIARKEKPDIIIMDVRLPDMRGTEAARILRQDKETCDIPIVFVTASVMAEGKEEINAITNSGFIGKPINTRTFAKEISQFINEGERLFCPIQGVCCESFKFKRILNFEDKPV